MARKRGSRNRYGSIKLLGRGSTFKAPSFGGGSSSLTSGIGAPSVTDSMTDSMYSLGGRSKRHRYGKKRS